MADGGGEEEPLKKFERVNELKNPDFFDWGKSLLTSSDDDNEDDEENDHHNNLAVFLRHAAFPRVSCRRPRPTFRSTISSIGRAGGRELVEGIVDPAARDS
mgnify:CR=1 FL=1